MKNETSYQTLPVSLSHLHIHESEESLRKSEALFKALVQNSTDIFLLTDNNFHAIYVSDACKSLLGYEQEAIIGKNPFELIHPEDKYPTENWLTQLSKSHFEMRSAEFRLKSNTGNWNYFEATGKNMLDEPQVASIVFTLRDIQAKKTADNALMNAEQRLTLLLNNTKESFIILNNKFKVAAYNKAAQENSPYFFRSELQSGLSLLDLVDAAETTTYINILDKVMEDNETSLDTSYTDENGKLHIYHHIFRRLSNANEHGIFITSSDITERRLAEIALHDNQEKFRTIIEYSFDAVVIIDEQANIIYASPSITNLLGFDPSELTGKNCFEFIYAEDAPGVKKKLASIYANIEETYADYRSLTKDGSLKWLEAKGKNMLDNKHIHGVLISLRDISERKLMLEEQTTLADELVKYNKDLQQFSFITSHNLRAPVANLISLLSLYNHDQPADPFNSELMNKFNECTDKLNDTLNDLINVLVIRSKPNADREYNHFEHVAAIVERALHTLLENAGGEIIHDFATAEGIYYNKVHLESIFQNLISNAIKYASPERKLKISIRSEQTPKGVRLHFSDNGIGIDLDRYGDRIFGLYQRFNASKDGKGLGLYMIKSQVTAAGGSIDVQSIPGEGTVFTVFFRQDQ